MDVSVVQCWDEVRSCACQEREGEVEREKEGERKNEEAKWYLAREGTSKVVCGTCVGFPDKHVLRMYVLKVLAVVLSKRSSETRQRARQLRMPREQAIGRDDSPGGEGQSAALEGKVWC